jgi:hypothetical protein
MAISPGAAISFDEDGKTHRWAGRRTDGLRNGQTDRHDEANNRFPQFFPTSLKTEDSNLLRVYALPTV